ncbi:MAG: 6-phosphogluconolactonase [Armatimonadaceae bacterium]
MLYIGTYAGANEPGIYIYEMDSAGKLKAVGTASGVPNPSFLAIHPNKKSLYAASEAYGADGGKVAAFAIENDGSLRLLNMESAKGNGPCHIVVAPSGKYALVANYGSGSVASLPIADDGSVKPATGFSQHTGSSVNEKRQKEPHAHSINVDATGKYAVAADLGTDKLYVYQLDAATGKLTPNEPAATSATPGAGPRHFAFHPGGKFAYAINELDNTVAVYQWDSGKGTLTSVQTINSLPDGFEGNNSTAEVQVHPSGKFLYGSNRGHNSIVIYSIHPESGKLTLVGHQSTEGKNPRNFGISPDGGFLLAANQDTNNVVVFRIDPATGKLTPTGEELTINKPVCVKFLPR